jgi:hypothetical protein
MHIDRDVTSEEIGMAKTRSPTYMSVSWEVDTFYVNTRLHLALYSPRSGSNLPPFSFGI